jgi:hypothetical protein
MTKHTAKFIGYSTYEYRGIKILSLKRYTSSEVGWQFTLEATEDDPVSELRRTSTLREAKNDIDIYLWEGGTK